MSFNLIKWAALLPLLLLCAETFANNGWDFAAAQKQRCSLGNPSEMAACLSDEARKAERRLDKKYKKLLAQLETPELLQHSQKKWGEFREYECKFSSSGVDDAVGAMSFFICKIDAAEKRIRDLDSYLACNEGGCPLKK